MFGRRIFLLGAAYFMVGFTRPSGAAESRTLVAFFSRLPEMPSGADAVTHATASTGNVEEAAKTIGALTGADLYAIRSSRKYPVLHRQNSIEAKKELDENARPPLSSPSVDLSKYSTVFIGFPIWWYQEPMIVRSFLEKYDWQGKTVIPFFAYLWRLESIAQKTISRGFAKAQGSYPGGALRAVRPFVLMKLQRG